MFALHYTKKEPQQKAKRGGLLESLAIGEQIRQGKEAGGAEVPPTTGGEGRRTMRC